jgi:hypothetical protein
LYKVPFPQVLANQHISYVIHTDPKHGAKEIESKLFFCKNSEVFRIYLTKIEEVPDNFYMFIDRILYFIKLNNMLDEVDPFWQQMINK